jgi:hypothetical protein
MRILIPMSLVLVLTVAGSVRSEPAHEPVTPEPFQAAVAPPRASGPAETGLDPIAPPVTPLQADMEGVLAEEAARIAELRAALADAADEAEVLRLQREAEACKLSTEIRILELQATHARAAGRDEAAAEIEAAVARLRDPAPPLQPADRPRDPDRQGR